MDVQHLFYLEDKLSAVQLVSRFDEWRLFGYRVMRVRDAGIDFDRKLKPQNCSKWTYILISVELSMLET